jgi:hypothetical protein
VWRPSLDDVQRISSGDAARHRGTGSRAVPHRLNAEERKQFELAKIKGLLVLSGSGYRRERKGSPLANIWRQWCDAKAHPCMLLAKGATAAAGDTVLVDFSVLRLPDVQLVSVGRLCPCHLSCGLHCKQPAPAPRWTFFTRSLQDSQICLKCTSASTTIYHCCSIKRHAEPQPSSTAVPGSQIAYCSRRSQSSCLRS